MTQEKRKAGRPPSQATQARRRAYGFLSERPRHLPEKRDESTHWSDVWRQGMDEAEEVALGPFRYGWGERDSHAFEMFALLEEGASAERTQALLSADEAYRMRAARRRKNGSRKTKLNSDRRRDALLSINEVLINKIGSRPYTPNKVAGMIHGQWETMTDAQRLPGEPATMTRRGDGGTVLSAGHIARWLRALTKQVRQGLFREK